MRANAGAKTVRIGRLVFVFFAAALVRAQNPTTGKTLQQVVELWSDKDFTSDQVLRVVNNSGVGFPMSEANLASLLDAARKADRPAAEVAQFIYAVFRKCQTCRSDFWPPLRKEDLLLILATGGPACALTELKRRGHETFPETADFLGELRKLGAQDDLVTAVSDTIDLPVLAGFQMLRLPKAVAFKPALSAGMLNVQLDLAGEAELVFRHNALFYRGIGGTPEPKNLAGYYSSYGPQGDPGRIQCSVVTEPKLKDAKCTVEKDPTGFDRIRIKASRSKKPQRHEFRITWNPAAAGTP